jgi:ATP-dependent RNA helicase DDX27
VAITICNDEERKELKKLSRKMNFQATTFSLHKKNINKYTEAIQTLEDPLEVISQELQTDKETLQALMEAKRAENMIKYKEDIASRPKNSWFQSQKEKEKIKKGSKGELGKQNDKFESTDMKTEKGSKKNKGAAKDRGQGDKRRENKFLHKREALAAKK